MSSLKDMERRKFCPVGKILNEVQVVILDNDLNQMPIGMPGEVYRRILYLLCIKKNDA